MTDLAQTATAVFKKRRSTAARPTDEAKTPDPTQPVRDRTLEAAAALNFWQALEYLAPQSPPAVKLKDAVWAVDVDTPEAALPWIDPKIARILDKQVGPKRRFQLFAGVIPGATLIETARQLLGSDPVDMSERRPAGPVACVVLDLDGAGMATGQVFVSTVPWAMASLAQGQDAGERLNFRGFFGPGGVEEQVRGQVRDLLVERHLLADEDEEGVKEADGWGDDGEAASGPRLRPTGAAGAQREAGAALMDPGVAATGPHALNEVDSVHPLLPLRDPLRSVTPADVSAITDLVFRLCGWHPPHQAPWHVQALLVKDKDADQAATLDDPLNSFYAEDLERVGEALDAGDIGEGLREYLHGEDSADRVDLERHPEALIEAVHPSHLPPGCWPSAHPLVSAQQFAVNTILRELGDAPGLFSVNGPPGTGKTTLLKDIVAAVVVKRADALAEFDDPLSALKDRLDIENHPYPAYELDERLRGFGIVVSSANNGAVENITKELPGLKAIANGLDIDYFSLVADSVAAPPKARKRAPQRGHWGLVAAVLGNKANRNQFANRFWLAGLASKSSRAGGKAGGQGDLPPPDPLRLRSLQDLFQTDDHGAMPWPEARARYRQARQKVDDLVTRAGRTIDGLRALASKSAARVTALAELEKVQARLPNQIELVAKAGREADQAADRAQAALGRLSLFQRLAQAQRAVPRAQHDLDAAEASIVRLESGGLDGAHAAHAQALKELANLREDQEVHTRHRPGFLSELFRTEFSRRWNARGGEFDAQLREARAREQLAGTRITTLQQKVQSVGASKDRLAAARNRVLQCQADAARGGVTPTDTEESLQAAHRQLDTQAQAKRQAAAYAQAQAERAERQERTLRETAKRADKAMALALEAIDDAPCEAAELKAWNLHAMDRATLHGSAPFGFQALFDARREVFIAAMALHQSFIHGAWRKLARTLSAFVNVLNGAVHPGQVRDGVDHLWDAFFLVVPVVSTTFASFPRLFAGMGRETLAWLLIDEAGQATPQQAVGAIWRARRAVIVGDPLQLEPVVPVPAELVPPLLRRCAAEPHWAPPEASAQTLADRTNRFGMYLGEAEDDADKVWLGAPLVVHRRCLDPMFGIANSLSYDDKMVHGTAPDEGSEGIGPSRWIDMPAGTSDGHWIESQGRQALALVEQLTGGVLRREGQFKVFVVTPFRSVAQGMAGLLYERFGLDCKGMFGTVHTFQGKEAEHVVFLLGGDPKRPGVISSFAGRKPNLVNVAVTRAKRRLYVIGDKGYWTGPGDVHRFYARMAERLALPVEAHGALAG